MIERCIILPAAGGGMAGVSGSVGADGRKCQKKVTQTPEGVWACEACGK